MSFRDTAGGDAFLPEDEAAVALLTLEVRRVVEGFLGGRHAALHRGASVEFAEYTRYFPGDDLRHLDWKALARSDKMYVKAREREVVLNSLLLLDASPSMNYAGSRAEKSKFAYARLLLGAVGQILLRQGDAVGLLAFADGPDVYLAPRQHPRHMAALFGQMAAVHPQETGHTNYAQAFVFAAEQLRQRSMVVVASDLWSMTEADEVALASLSARGHDVVVFHVLSPDEIDLPHRSAALFRDMETGRAVFSDPALVREDYRRAVQREIARIDGVFGRAQIDVVHAVSNVPPQRVLSELKSRRASARVVS
ncbi:MAG: DUF58 domain-containing protein [Myxococcales bacterium]|jgi:uncharacterized protein (DUF58 family)|nr:DUF58 domain-containing protein [Myxococcales bacterium]